MITYVMSKVAKLTDQKWDNLSFNGININRLEHIKYVQIQEFIRTVKQNKAGLVIIGRIILITQKTANGGKKSSIYHSFPKGKQIPSETKFLSMKAF